MNFQIKNRFNGSVSYECKLSTEVSGRSYSFQLGFAVKEALKSGAYLIGAYLRGVKGADLAIARTRILPEGEIIAWKKCKNNVIVKMRIPAEAKRSHAWGRKCRAEFADVLEVQGADVGISLQDNKTRYVVGERVTPDRFDENWQDECYNGIHFYISRAEAEAHV